PRDRADLERAKQRLDVPLDTATIYKQCAFLLCPATRFQNATSLCIGKVHVAKLCHGRGLALFLFVGCRVAALGDLAQEPLRFLARHVRSPGRTVPTDGVPTLAAVAGPVIEDIGDSVATLASGTKPSYARIPGDLSRLERFDDAGSQPLAHCRLLAS